MPAKLPATLPATLPAKSIAAFARSSVVYFALAGTICCAGGLLVGLGRLDDGGGAGTGARATLATPTTGVAAGPTADGLTAGAEAWADGAELSGVLKALSPEEQMYHQHVVTLSNPFFEGRAPGLRGNVLAQEYVEFYFREKFKLEPLFAVEGSTAKSYRQEFDAGRESVVTGQKVVISADGKDNELVVGTDYNVLGVSASAEATGDIVFCGYSMEEGVEGYETYAKGDDLTGKIAVILRFEPKNEAGKSKWSKTGAWSPKAGLGGKLGAARERGAAAMILVNPPGADDPRNGSLEDFRSIRGLQGGTPVVMMSIEQMTALCKSAGKDLMTLVKEADEKGGITPLPNVKATVAAKIERRPIKTANVAGVLRGKGALADEYIIIGGHYDHLGYGYFGSRSTSPAGKLHPGADDNASGTSGVLMSAQQMSEAYKKLEKDANVRSIIFMCFSAEESGLHGSRFFVRNSPVSAEKTYIMLNMDMIGRLRKNKIEVGGGGSGDGLCEIIEPILADSGLIAKTRSDDGVPFNGGGPSDHASFFGGGIPVLFFFTGLHPQYHTAIDLYPSINVPGAVKVASTVSAIATKLAGRTEPLVFNREVGKPLAPDYSQTNEKPEAPATKPETKAAKPAEVPAKPVGTPAAKGPAAAAGGGGTDDGQPKIRVKFGIKPSQDEEIDGVLVDGITAETPAAESDLKAGDIIKKWNDKPIESFTAWMPLLSAAKPGDVVTITYLRGTETRTTKVTLTGREEGGR